MREIKFSYPKPDKEILDFIKNLMNKNSKALGFIPITAIKKAIKKDKIILCKKKEKKIGFLYSGPIREGKDLTIYQICIISKEQRKGYGERMLRYLLKKAKDKGARGIRLRCADDLKANDFWKSMGFNIKNSEYNKNKTRKINTYYKSL